MTNRSGARGFGRALLAVLLLLAPVASAAAQGVRGVLLGVSTTEPLPATPQVFYEIVGLETQDRPFVARLQASMTPDFATLVVDTTLAAETGSVVIQRILPERSSFYFRIVVRTRDGEQFNSLVVGPRSTGPRLTLISPTGTSGVTLTERRPTFTWSSAPIIAPPGPWLYDFSLVDVSTGRVELLGAGLSDTAFQVPVDLEVNRAYRWFVRAYAARGTAGDTARASSASSFVITPENAPLVTLLYQNFPNPFPNAVVSSTCIWFDLRRPAEVTLEVLDLRGRLVKRLIPSEDFVRLLPAGRYGRTQELGGARSAPGSGCDPRLAWDGTGADGRVVRPGVYLLRFAADGQATVRRMLFRGR